MWNHGSMGWQHGWHYGQAHDMMREMHEHARVWDGNGGMGGDPGGILGSFITSFAERMGEKAANALTGTNSEGDPTTKPDDGK